MQKAFALFPGCVLTQAAAEANKALLAIAPKLGLTLTEIPGWSCCGASHVQDADPVAALVANARNLALAEKMGLPMLTVCSTCLLMLRKAKAELDGGKKETINTYLSKGGMSYAGTVEVTNLLWVLAQDVDGLKKAVTKPLKGLKVAPFYGCHTVRPQKVLGFESSVNPRSLDEVVAALGAESVNFDRRLGCCGFHAIYPAEDSALKLTSGIVTSAAEAGAQCIVTPCPLCQMQIDINLKDANSRNGASANLPVLHLQQLVGLALGLSAEALGLDNNIIDATHLAKVN